MGFYSLDVEDNEFWGRVVASFAPSSQPVPADWRPHQRWYAVLHKFGPSGKHIGTDHWFAGTSADGEREVCERASKKLDEMVAALGPVEYSDILVELFQVEVEGRIFGLVDVSKPEEGPMFAERVEMWPDGLLFYPPWDGNYDT
jgi:formate hydrogenlyase regulatory protein HycA